MTNEILSLFSKSYFQVFPGRIYVKRQGWQDLIIAIKKGHKKEAIFLLQ